jgi:hypothetical protein
MIVFNIEDKLRQAAMPPKPVWPALSEDLD